MAKSKIKFWVLKDGNRYFREWTPGIGPRSTATRGDAERFPSRKRAEQSPAYSFALMFYEPFAVR